MNRADKMGTPSPVFGFFRGCASSRLDSEAGISRSEVGNLYFWDAVELRDIRFHSRGVYGANNGAVQLLCLH